MVLGSLAFVPVAESEYRAILEARSGLFECLYLEEKFDLVIENYLELETWLLESTARHMVFGGQDYRWFQVERGLCNRRLANLLSTGRSYVDQAKYHVKRIFPSGSDQFEIIVAKFSEQYDTRLGYRSMEALRNFVQHRGFAADSLVYEMKRVQGTDGAGLRFAANPYLSPPGLRASGGFKEGVLSELEAIGEQVDLKGLVRDYVEGLWTVHDVIRERIKSLVQQWETLVCEAIDLFKSMHPEEGAIGLSVVARKSEGIYPESAALFMDFIEYRKILERKNGNLVNLANRYVSSEVIKKQR